MVGDESLEQFRVEYEKLLRALRKSNDKGRKLFKKCKEMNAELVANAAKVQAALRLSEDDQQTIAALKKEVESAWQEADESREKETRLRWVLLHVHSALTTGCEPAGTRSRNTNHIVSCCREQVQTLRAELQSLQTDSDKLPRTTIIDEEMQELMASREELAKERDEQVAIIAKLRAEIAESSERQRVAERERAEMAEEVIKARAAAKEREKREDVENKRRERQERAIKDLKASLEAKTEEVKAKVLAVQHQEEESSRIEMMLRERENQFERLNRDFNMILEKSHRLQQDLDEQVHQNTQLLAQVSQQQLEVRARDEEIAALKAEMAKLSKARDAALAKVRTVEKQRSEAEKAK